MRTTSFREIVESGRVRSARALCTRASGARGIASFFRVALPVALSVAVASVLILGASPVRAQSPPLEAFFTSGARVATTAENGESWSPNDVCRPPIHGSMLDGGSGTAHRGGVTDNDAAHYARGSVMVVLVFVDHDGGSWDPAGRDEQAAKAADAKQYYLDRVPNEAFVTFDHENSSGYYYYYASVPYDINDYDDFEDWMVADAAESLGFVDSDGDGSVIDEMTFYNQGTYGGWDNVIAVFVPADYTFHTAQAGWVTSWCKLSQQMSYGTWAHEWGHVFGACDEGGSPAGCNGIECTDVCMSYYLVDQVPNGNCSYCTAGVDCLMRGYVNVPPCTYTHRNWGWWDTNGDGRVDNTMAWDADSQSLYELWELFHNGYMIHTNTTWGMVATQRWTSWSVMGVRSRGNSSYGMAVYADNNRNDFLEADYVSPGVRFVVGDYNHNRLGNDFIRLYNFGGNGQYVLSYEAGSQVLYPDGVDRAQSWSSTNVVKAFDMPLLGGETIQIQLDIDTAGLDLGMALFKSNGDVYYGSRQDAVWEEDDWPAGISESYTFDVPEDDVYGLIVWSNNEVAGSFSIKIGPTLRSLDEATPFLSYLDLSLYSYSPYTNYWAVAAARPGASSNVTLRLFGDSHFEDELATSGAYPNIELIAADYNPGYSTDYLRTIRKSGVNPHQTEWEQGSDILAGFEDHTWENGHICKVWDAHLQAGQEYRFQRYGSVFAPLTTRIFLFSSADGDRYKQRSGAAAGAAAATPEGEWFTYTAPADDWYGFVMMNEDDSSGGYSVGVGPYVVLDEEESASFTDQVIWADFDTQAGSWNVVGVRPEEGGSSAMWLWDCEDRFSPCYLDGDAYGDLVRYVVLDGNHLPADTYYARADRLAGTGVQTVSFDSAPAAALSLPDPDAIVIGQGTFSDGEVARIHDFALGFTPASVVVTVTPGSTALDVGVALFRSRSGQYIQGSDQAVAEANDGGPGIPEQMTASLTVRDTYGLVVTNRSGVAGEYEIRIQHLDAADVEQEAAPDRLDLQALGTATGHPTLRLALPETGPVRLDVFDVRGRLVQNLVDKPMEAGTHEIRWDGDRTRDRTSGVYFVRLRALADERTLKVVTSR